MERHDSPGAQGVARRWHWSNSGSACARYIDGELRWPPANWQSEFQSADFMAGQSGSPLLFILGVLGPEYRAPCRPGTFLSPAGSQTPNRQASCVAHLETIIPALLVKFICAGTDNIFLERKASGSCCATASVNISINILGWLSRFLQRLLILPELVRGASGNNPNQTSKGREKKVLMFHGHETANNSDNASAFAGTGLPGGDMNLL